MTEINYWDSWKIAREKINNILDIAENSIPSIWENWHWFLWNTDTWINAQWPQWEQGIQWPQWIQWEKWEQWVQGEQWIQGEKWEKWNKWDKGDKWEKWEKWEQGDKWEKWDTGAKWEQGEQWIQWEKWDKWDKWEKWDQWIQGPQWEQGIQWEQWPQWPEWPEWPTWPAWTYTPWQWINITDNTISADDMKADVQSFTSKYQMTQWDTAKKWDIAKVQNTETNTIIFNGSTTVLNWVEWWLKNFVVPWYTENVSPLPAWYVQYDKVNGNATISTWLSWDLATYTISWDQWAFKLRQNGELVFNAIPCKNTSNVVGFYDLVSDSFFTPSSTLTAGTVVEWPTPEVPRPIMTNNWILKYNQWTSEWYTEWDQETIKISYLW